MSGNQPEGQQEKYTFNYTLASVVVQVGCFTVILTLGAFAAGFYIDRLLGSSPWFTLILMIGSVPLNLIMIYRAVKTNTSKMVVPPPNNSEKTPKKEEDFDTNE